MQEVTDIFKHTDVNELPDGTIVLFRRGVYGVVLGEGIMKIVANAHRKIGMHLYELAEYWEGFVGAEVDDIIAIVKDSSAYMGVLVNESVVIPDSQFLPTVFGDDISGLVKACKLRLLHTEIEDCEFLAQNSNLDDMLGSWKEGLKEAEERLAEFEQLVNTDLRYTRIHTLGSFQVYNNEGGA